MDDDGDSGLDSGLNGDLDGGSDNPTTNWSHDEEGDYAEAFALGIHELGRGNPDRHETMVRNGGLSKENLARVLNEAAGLSPSHNLDRQSSSLPDARPALAKEHTTVRLRGHRRRTSVVSESRPDQESEQENIRSRAHRRQSI
jgi:hypothetical protein